jgi:hypothetical protein
MNEAATGDNGMHGAPEPHLFRQSGGASTKAPAQLTYNKGSVLHTANIYAIYWGDWSSGSDKIAGMEAFFKGYSGSGYANILNEYYDNSGPITGNTVFKGSYFDTSAAPPHAINANTAFAEACNMANVISSQNPTQPPLPGQEDIYFLFTSTGAGHVSFCAWHNWGTCPNGTNVQVAYMPNLDGVAGCGAQDSDPTTYPNKYDVANSAGLAALANVTAHELSEAITDPRGDGWLDQNNQEVGDKCAWQFNGSVTLSDGNKWKLQELWSDGSGGCIQSR